jgi:hypothetical protein
MSAMITMATGHEEAEDDVWQAPDVMAMLLVGADGKARAEATGHRGVRGARGRRDHAGRGMPG